MTTGIVGLEDIIDDVWKNEVSLELPKRITLWNFRVGKMVQGNDTVKDFYSKLKEYNKSVSYHEERLKWLFLHGLSPENMFKVQMDWLEELALDEIVKSLSPEQ